MEKLRFPLSFLALLLAAYLALSCGAGQSQLQSMALSPAQADAQSYPSGQVPFIATGHYSNPTHTVTPQPANWIACQQNAPTSDVYVSNTGVAHCASGATGTYSIEAWDIPNTVGVYNCPTMTACGGGGCKVQAAAQLTCP
jgi:hypothetical protein